MINRFVCSVFAIGLSFISSTSLAAKPNVLLISIDTLRADHLGCYGHSQKTPAIDALAAKGVLFENTISQVPLTLPSHSSIFTGLYPDQHGVRNNENFVLDKKYTTLAEMFRENGYATGAVVGSFSLDSSFQVDQGFQFYNDKIGTGHDPEVDRHVERRAENVWKLGRQWLETQKGPWFCFLHFFDPHFPFNPPSGFPQTYHGEIAYTDKIIGQVLQSIDYNTTIVLLLSDHGEALGDHGEENHGVFLYDATLKVPLIIAGPSVTPRRVTQQVRLVDVAPTIADLASLVKKPSFSGISLVQHLKGTGKELPAYSESYYTNMLMGWAPLHSIRWNQKKWINSPKAEFYDLAKDPMESKNLYSSSAVPNSYRSELNKHLQKKPPTAANAELDPETREKLASLGYVTGGSGNIVTSGFDPKDGIKLWTTIEAAVRHAQLSEWNESEKLFRDVLKRQPDNVIAKKFLANVLRKQGKNQEAISLLESAMKSELHQAETRLDLSETYFEVKKYPESLELLLPVVNTGPPNIRALTLAAWLFSHFERDRDALEAYRKLSDLRTLQEEEALNAAGICLTSRDASGAEKYFRLALDANGKSAPAWKGMGLILASRQQWDKALDAFLNAGDCAHAKDVFGKLNSPPSSLAIRLKETCQ